MCVGIPMQITQVDTFRATAFDGDASHEIDLSLVGTQPVGTWVLTFLGAARDVLDPDDALKIKAAVDNLRAVMSGHDTGIDAFADIEARGPQLPPHLQAALDAGKSTA
ncbi:HypC/HybG/HupF family hydrogenase formation chaperone [Marivita hallyeonensis]|uniref:Hydrogenase expression/formation protein HypC n=1 Tax=Marivita hallyeonensis TaxID=996342 RepID=A0A1M5MKB7_9RHOB|nr:HypC/HybG/HupF family hydrogenase formation chaperone [Marivita hallyeonensis]SHG77748.1 hydrogenase expression/formation protein HypC [Marivita hallyeonensis]